MRHRQVGAVATAVSFVMLLLASTAPSIWATGASIESEEGGHRPGETAVARVTFLATPYPDGSVSDGPFQAYLVPYTKPLKPGPIPSSAVAVGEIRIIPKGIRRWTAVIEFEVPRVDPGLYKLDYCNVPCTVWGIEELEAGSFEVLKTIQQARFDEVEAAIDAMRQKVRRPGGQ